MKHWWSNEAQILGDYKQLQESIFEDIRNGIHRLRGDRALEPVVSVVVIAYNEQMRLAACLMSLSRNQCSWPVEVIVVNNNSTDLTQEIMTRSGVIALNEVRQGVGYARNCGLNVAQGKYLVSCDADTIYPVHYIETMVNRLVLDPKLAAVFAPYWFLNDGRKSLLSLNIYSFFRDIALALRSINRPELAAGGAAMVFRTAQGQKIKWRNDIRRGEDGAMILGLKTFGRTSITLNSRCRVRSTSRTLDSDGSLLSMIAKRIKRETVRLGAYFTRKNEYKDQDYNKL